MSVPYEGLEKTKRGQYKYRVANLYVTITKVDDKIWNLTWPINAFGAIKDLLPKLYAFEQVMSLVKVEAKTLADIYHPLLRINELLGRKVVATNKPIRIKQLNDAPIGSKIEMPHLSYLGDLRRSPSWVKASIGLWKIPNNSSYTRMEATALELSMWSEFGDAVLEPYEGEKLELRTGIPRLQIGDYQADIAKITLEFDRNPYSARKVDVTLYFKSKDRNPLRFTVEPSELPDLILPPLSDAREVDPETVKAEAIGCEIHRVVRAPLECVGCGRSLAEGERYMHEPRGLRFTCMACAFPSEEAEKAKEDPMARIATAMERIAKTQEKQAKDMKYGAPYVMMRRF